MGRKEKKTENRQIDNKSSFQVRLDKSYWKTLSQLKTETGKSFKELLEGALVDTYKNKEKSKPY